jgi:hypothetical protein
MLAAIVPTEAKASPNAVQVCALGDLVSAATACSGFYAGNLLSNNASDITAQKAGLAAIGFTWDGNFAAVEKINSLNGSKIVDFAKLLNAISFVGFHFGNGQGGPGNATAFYKIDAGVNLDTFKLTYNASSGAVLYSTGEASDDDPSAVPEPASWMLLLAGFGFLGIAMRRAPVTDLTA